MRARVPKRRVGYGLNFPGRTFAFVLFLIGSTVIAEAQIGGRTAADGPFALDDVEDLDLTAIGVGRQWIPDYVYPTGDDLTAESLAGSGLTLAAGQSPVGGLKVSIPAVGTPLAGYSINAGFGVPMPGVVGASTLTSPGNITSFSSLTMLTCYQQVLSGQKFQVLLECYPQNGDGSYPTLVWDYTPTAGTTFHLVQIDLHSPALIGNNNGALTVDQLLSQTRFLYFYFFASPVSISTHFTAHIDDIRLIGSGATPTPTPTPTGTPTPTPTSTPTPTPTSTPAPTPTSTPTPTPTSTPTPTPTPTNSVNHWELYR